MPTWVRGISIPVAMVGILAFFLPWVAVSCGPVRVTVSGYELASGSYNEKFSGQGVDDFWRKTGDDLNRQTGARQKQKSLPKKNQSVQGTVQRQDNVPMLWTLPAACIILVLLGAVGLPRTPTMVVSALAAAYLAYFGITSEQQLNDPRNTGGILSHEWLVGYWLGWIGLLGPMFVAIFRPREKEESPPL